MRITADTARKINNIINLLIIAALIIITDLSVSVMRPQADSSFSHSVTFCLSAVSIAACAAVHYFKVIRGSRAGR